MINKDDLIKITRDPDFVYSPKHGNSLAKLLDQYPDGAPDHLICKVLCITQKELEDLHASAIIKLREGMNADE